MKIILGVLAVLGILTSDGASATGLISDLSAAQQSALLNGEQVFVTQDDASSAWPKAWVYQLIHSTPEEAAAVFFEYEAGVNYLPNVRKSKISRRMDARTCEVDYTLSVPVMKDEWYTIRNVLSSFGDGNRKGFRVDWTLVRARSTQGTVGYARFESIRSETALIYYNFVTPGSSIAGAVKGKAMKQVRDTVHALVKEIERVRTHEVQTLQARVDALRAALK